MKDFHKIWPININRIVYRFNVFVFSFLHELNTDIDECDGVNDCHDNADCANTDGSYDCTCKVGYSGDGKTCSGMLLCLFIHVHVFITFHSLSTVLLDRGL